MPHFEIKYNAQGSLTNAVDYVDAAYYKREDSWVSFKNFSHAVIFDVPDYLILSIRMTEDDPGTETTERYKDSFTKGWQVKTV